MATSIQPNSTLYINNLNDKINKDELRSQLLALFTTYGKIIDIVASKNQRMRGQAFLVFTDLAGATSAMRACEGMVFYDKPLHIAYAKTKSYATSRRENPMFVPPTAANSSSTLVSQNTKRQRDGENAEGEPSTKRGRDEEDEEEMEIDDEDDSAQSKKPASINHSPTVVPSTVPNPSAHLLCTNLPQEVTDDVLAVLFQQYQGFQTTHVTWSPTPNATGERVKMAQVAFESPELAFVARTALDGFTLKKGWVMSVVFV